MSDQNLEISTKLFNIIRQQDDIHTKNESILFDNVKKLGEQVDDDINLAAGYKIEIDTSESDILKIGVKENDIFCITDSVTKSFSEEQVLSIDNEILYNDMKIENNNILLDKSKNYILDAQVVFEGKSENPNILVSMPIFEKNGTIVEKTYKITDYNTIINLSGLVTKLDKFYIKAKSKTKSTAKIQYLQIIEL